MSVGVGVIVPVGVMVGVKVDGKVDAGVFVTEANGKVVGLAWIVSVGGCVGRLGMGVLEDGNLVG